MSYDDFEYYIGSIKNQRQFLSRNEDCALENCCQAHTALIHLLSFIMKDSDGLISYFVDVLDFGRLADEEIGEPADIKELYQALVNAEV